MSEDLELAQDELATLKQRADLLGVNYHPSIGVDKLRDKLAAATADKEPVKPEAPAALTADQKDKEAQAPAVETEHEFRRRMKQESLRLVRIRLTCMNPAKKDWDGELITVGNTLIGSISKFVPFNAEDGWHVPHMMYEFLKERQCQIFVTTKSRNGVSVRQGKMIKEFAIEELPSLTKAELEELARRQAMANKVD